MLAELENPDQLTDGVPRSATGEEPQVYGDPTSGGELLEEEDLAKVAKRIVKYWEDLDPLMAPRLVQWKVNALRRAGVPNLKAQMRRDGSWFVWKAPNVTSADSVPAFRKAADLCRKLVSFMWSDPPAPEAVPPSGEDDDVNAAEFATRALEDLQGEATLDDAGRGRRAFDRACSYGSGFLWYQVKPHAGGRVAVRVRAGRDPLSGRRAETMDDAINDPMTGFPWPEYESRFVGTDGRLLDSEEGAATRWAPGMVSSILDGRSVRMYPPTAADLRRATCVLIHEFLTVGEVKETWEDALAEMGPDRDGKEPIERLVSYRPDKVRDLVPGSIHKLLNDATGDDRLVSVFRYYREVSPLYPEGAHIVVLGGQLVATREPWARKVKKQTRRLLIPLTQYGQFSEGEENPYLVGLMQILGPAEELRNAVWASLLDHIDRTANRKTFIPTASPVHPKHLNAGGYRYLPIGPNGEPKYEEVPPFPGENLTALEMVDQGMDNGSGLQQSGQGMEAKGVQSGRHAYAILSQVHTVLSELSQNIERAYVRGCRIQMQLVQAFYEMEQRIKWVGDDGDYKEKDWSGSDFENTEDVRLRPGTLTGLSPASKEEQAKEYAQAGLLQPHELRETIRENVGGRLGLQDDPQLSRIRRQIAGWKAGPPEGWEPPQPTPITQPDPLTGAPIPVMDPMTGQPAMNPPAPDPTLAGILLPVPSDELPDVAPVRLHEIAKLMASKAYLRHPPEWREAMAQEFARMKAVVFPPAPAPPMQPAAAPAPPPQMDAAPPEVEVPPFGIVPEPGL